MAKKAETDGSNLRGQQEADQQTRVVGTRSPVAVIANISSAVAMVIVLIATALPFFLSVDRLQMHMPSGVDSAAMRSLKVRESSLESLRSRLTDEKLSGQRKYPGLAEQCRLAMNAVGAAKVAMITQPDCGRFIHGESVDSGINANTLPEANRSIDALKRAHDELADFDRRIDKLNLDIMSVLEQHDMASMDAEKTHYSQLELFLTLARYGSLGAIGAIGFNLIMRLGVFDEQRAPKGSRPKMMEIAFYLIGCMIVAAILSIILVPRLTDISDPNGAYPLTATGISLALAAGLVGDVALRSIRGIFRRAADTR
jgi:hypothetical protein